MKELSLNILDITMNSVKAHADDIGIEITERGNLLTVVISDNGCGMSEQTIQKLSDPFYTTRTTRKVGMGIPFYMLAARQTGGDVVITSTEQPDVKHGTVVTATFYTDHIDFTPLGDIISTLVTLIQGYPDIDFTFTHSTESGTVALSTKELREQLGCDIPLGSFEVLEWIKDYLQEQYTIIHTKGN